MFFRAIRHATLKTLLAVATVFALGTACAQPPFPPKVVKILIPYSPGALQMSWFNHQRLMEPLGYVPPAEFEGNYFLEQQAMPA